MKKQLIFTLALVCLIIMGAEAKDGLQFSYGPDGKNFFTKASDKILIQFGNNVTFAEKASTLSK
ncbi:MAG: hypothetical protein ACI9LA_002256, partial [Bacteroidia bacterium]